MKFEEKLAAAAATLRDNRAAGESPGGRSTRQEPTFSDFDEADYEEPDRDTDYATAYENDNLEEEDSFAHTPDEEADEEEFAPARDITRHAVDAVAMHPALADTPDDVDPDWEETQLEDAEEEAYDDDYNGGRAARRGRWPLGLIAMALVALLLLAAGGYGVIQERSAMQEQISQLNARLATASDSKELVHSLSEMRNRETASEEQTQTIEALTVENRRLSDLVAGLESQLEAQNLTRPSGQGAAAPQPAATGPEAPAAAKPAQADGATPQAPAAVPAPDTSRPAAAAPADGDWFVNFGSYSQSAAAQGWARRLKPEAGRVVVAGADRDGASFYRVRVVGLPDRAAAEQVSRQLEAQYGLPKLWVGRE